MKKIIKPLVREEAVYYSDFSGKCFGELPAPIEISIAFLYGSKHDGAGIQLHLDDEEIKPILDVIKNSISEDYKADMKKTVERYEKNYEDSMQMRDWDHCDIVFNNLWFWREILGLTNQEEGVE